MHAAPMITKTLMFSYASNTASTPDGQLISKRFFGKFVVPRPDVIQVVWQNRGPIDSAYRRAQSHPWRITLS